MTIRLFNTMSGRKEVFETIEPNAVRFYACGPTVYNLFHVGNARMFVVFDTVRRYLEYRGYDVKFVQNFTDVDDRIIRRANELNRDVRWVADHYIEEYFRDAQSLNIRPATVHPRATESVEDMIAFIQDLICRGHAYVSEGDVYFDTSSFAEYGKLSHQSLDEMQSGFRVQVLEHKDDPTDFALWKAAKPGEEFWDSPFGPGRPGWHIECSVMSAKYLGEQIDIHGGGRDLVFPHHENEIAQSEARSGKRFAKYWIHNGTLNINGEKMSKSLGNFIMTRDLLDQRPAPAIRLFLLSSQYRHPLNYTEESMDQALSGWDRIVRCLRNLDYRLQALEAVSSSEGKVDIPAAEENAISEIRTQFVEAMDDDFNTADGIAALFEGVKRANTAVGRSTSSAQLLRSWRALIVELLEPLGMDFAFEDALEIKDEEIESLIEERVQARKRRDFQEADRIRDELMSRGIVIEDTAQGTRWFRQ